MPPTAADLLVEIGSCLAQHGESMETITAWWQTTYARRQTDTEHGHLDVVWLAEVLQERQAYYAARAHQTPPRPVCPQCHGPLDRITYPGDSSLNPDQWAATSAGDYACHACPDNGRSTSGTACFWRREVEGPHA